MAVLNVFLHKQHNTLCYLRCTPSVNSRLYNTMGKVTFTETLNLFSLSL